MENLILACSKCGARNRIPALKQHQGPRCGKCGEPLPLQGHGAVIELGDSSLDSFLQNSRVPVLVDFFSPTCGPCRTLAPVLDDLAKDFGGKLAIIKVDTSRNPGSSAHFRIRGVPTLIFFRNGKKVDELVGLPEPRVLREKLNSVVAGKF